MGHLGTWERPAELTETEGLVQQEQVGRSPVAVGRQDAGGWRPFWWRWRGCETCCGVW